MAGTAVFDSVSNGGMTLTNGNLTAQLKNNNGGSKGVVASDLYNAITEGSPFYYELTVDAWVIGTVSTSNALLYIGAITDKQFNAGSLTGRGFQDVQNGIAFRLNQSTKIVTATCLASNSTAGTATTFPAAGDVYGFYLDPLLGIFLSQNGTWIAGDPNTSSITYNSTLQTAFSDRFNPTTGPANGHTNMFIGVEAYITSSTTPPPDAEVKVTLNSGPSFSGGGSFNAGRIGKKTGGIAQTLFKPTEALQVKVGGVPSKRYHGWFKDVDA